MRANNSSVDKSILIEFNEFIHNNRIKVNKYLNIVLWFFVMTGPSIAIGLKLSIFHDIEYSTCAGISAITFIMAAAHFLLLRKYPDSVVTSIFALLVLDGLLVYMDYYHIAIYLTWFLVPVLSILFCERIIFIFALIVNYIFMLISTWLSAPHEATLDKLHMTSFSYFTEKIGGFTIETVVMLLAGYIVSKLSIDYFKSLISQQAEILQQEKQMQEKIEILDSMAEIYENVNLINFIDNTEMSLRSGEQKKHGIDMNTQTHTIMNQRIKQQVMPDQIDDFLKFTDIKTVRSRLSHKKLISADFIDVVTGWFRAQYITVDATLDGIPNVVIFTTRNVDDEKRREEHLIRLSLTDELTRLYNRRCYEEDLNEIRANGLDENFVILSIDVNGLKKVNDTLGHAAGDELIKGAADCIALSVRSIGKVYRTGGDEFFAIFRTEDPENVCNDIKTKASEWHGIYSDKMSMSLGYATHKEKPKATIDDLEHIADGRMYEDKERYYKENGIERRR